MGNCLCGGIGDQTIKVIRTSNGSVMELNSPITAGRITMEFPGHAIFRSHDLFWKPLSNADELLAGNSYYLVPLSGGGMVREGHVRSSSVPEESSAAAAAALYRTSFDCHGMLERPYKERDRYGQVGFWKVKLVISPEQLLEILSKECKTRELIESVRTVAKCGSDGGGTAFSDEWSLCTNEL